MKARYVHSATTVTAAVGGAAVLASAPVWAPVAIGIIAGTALTMGINKIDNRLNVTKNLKSAWIKWVKN